jgi:hypothetical protein
VLYLRKAPDKRLASFVVLNALSIPKDSDTEDIVCTLRSSLRDSLPVYMVPAEIYVLTAMPLTPNGKINRAALHAPQREAAHTCPVTLADSQLKVEQIWTRLLKNDGSIDIDANFFDMGGHSLLATRLIMGIHNRIVSSLLF